MKRPLIFLSLFCIMGASALLSEDLPPLDPSRPMCQMKEGFPSKAISWPILGGLKECRLPDPTTVEDLKKQLEMQALRHEQEMVEREKERDIKQKEWESFWGGMLKIAGWVLIAVGVALHLCSSVGALKSCGSTIFVLGLAGVIGGLAIQKTVQADKWLTVAFWGFVAVSLMFALRKWSISKLPFVDKYVKRVQDKMDKYRKPSNNT